MGNITIRKANERDADEINALITNVFHGEQDIPIELIPIPEEMEPQWWCAEEAGVILGTIALYREKNEWHLGRFAVSPEKRNSHIGSCLLKKAVQDIFSSGIQEVYCEARDTTVHIMERFGGKTTGKAVPFFKGTVTPMVLSKDAFREL